MQRNLLLAFGFAATVGLATGVGCSYPQPAFECSFLSPYWASYTLTSGTGTCSTYTGDVIGAQRYYQPGAAEATVAILSQRYATLTRSTPDGDHQRVSMVDGGQPHESVRGSFSDLYPSAEGVCTMKPASVVPGYEDLPSVSVALKDGGVDVVPATRLKYEVSNFRLLNTARFPGTIMAADVTVTEDGCTATYRMEAINPIVYCSTDDDCDPTPGGGAGTIGSGLKPEYAPKCKLFAKGSSEKDIADSVAGAKVDGVCVSTVPFDDLAQLK